MQHYSPDRRARLSCRAVMALFVFEQSSPARRQAQDPLARRGRPRPDKIRTSCMVETKNPGDKTLSVGSSKTLTLKRTGVEQGVVRQSFSHGRTKQVVVCLLYTS